ncbi:MAG: hypothetical protein ACKO5E_02675 [bacterium]
MLLPDIETWKSLTDNGTDGKAGKQWQRLDEAYEHFYYNQNDTLARENCEAALDAFLTVTDNNTTRNSRGALTALKATITTQPDLLTKSTLEAARELRKSEEIAIFKVLGTLEFAENPNKKLIRTTSFGSKLSDFKSSADDVSAHVEKMGLISDKALSSHLIDNYVREIESHFNVSEIVGHATSSVVPAVHFLDKLKVILTVLGPLTPIMSTGKIVYNIAQIVNNKLDFKNNKAARAFAKKGDVQFSIDVLNERINNLNHHLELDTVRAAIDIGSFLLIPATGGVSKVATDALGAAIDVLVSIRETHEINNTINRVNSEIKTFRNKKELLDLMLDVPELAAYFLCNIETNTFLRYCSFHVNQPFFMLIVEENKHKIDSIIQQSRKIIENSPYQVKHHHDIEKEIQLAREQEMAKIQQESQDIMEISQKIQEMELANKRREDKAHAQKQRRLLAWQMLEAQTRATVADFENTTIAHRASVNRLVHDIRHGDESIAAIEELKKELAGHFSPEAKFKRIRQLIGFLLGKRPDWHDKSLVKLDKGSQLYATLHKNYQEFLIAFPEYAADC